MLYNQKILVTVTANEVEYLPSLTLLFFSAGWLEREV